MYSISMWLELGVLSFFMYYSQSCFSICNLLGALKNATPSSGEMSLLDESSAQTKGNRVKTPPQLDKIKINLDSFPPLCAITPTIAF